MRGFSWARTALRTRATPRRPRAAAPGSTPHAGIELYAEVFAAAGALEHLEGFASRHGAQFYRLPVNTESVTLTESPWSVPEEIAFGPDRLVPLRAGATVAWKLA